MRVLQFSVFELDEQSGELSRGGRRVALAHQAFVVLWMLASRAGTVVTREELRGALWAGGTHVDFERGLNFAVATVRRVLHDDARSPKFVETVTKRGYRFIADVRVRISEPGAFVASVIVPETQPDGVAARSRWPASFRRWTLAAAIPIMCAQGSGLLHAHTRESAAPLALAAFERGDYEAAIALDSRFAEAHFALASQYKTLGDSSAIPPRAALEKARLATRRAMALEDAPESRNLMGSLRLALDWDVEGARNDIARALDAAPNWDVGLATMADVMSAAGDDMAALDAIGRAERLSPSCELIAWQSAVLHFRARQYDIALAELGRARELGPLWGRGGDRNWIESLHRLSLAIYVQQGHWRGARGEAVALAVLHGADAERVRALQRLTPRDAVNQFLQRSADALQTSHDRDAVPASRFALAYAMAGRTDEALSWLERAADDREANLLFVLRDPALDTLRGLPRYQAVLTATRRPDRHSH